MTNHIPNIVDDDLNNQLLEGSITDLDDSQEPEEEISAHNIIWGWTDSGIPIVVADSIDILDHMDNQMDDFTFYYLIATKITERTEYNVRVKNQAGTLIHHNEYTFNEAKPAIFKVAKALFGWSVTEVDEDLLQHVGLSPMANHYGFNLPLIPKALLLKVDNFLRLADQKHHCESILILTFDPECVDEVTGEYLAEGWGVLVPNQENSAAHCQYDPSSIIDDKPDHVVIVGSIHSHPGMAAYASGTDHKDQADFDGIHITFGWYGRGPTEYYAEFQMQGQSWRVYPNDLFEPWVEIDENNEEINKWVEKVVHKQDAASKAQATNLSLYQKTMKTGGSTTGVDTIDVGSYDLGASGLSGYKDVHQVAWERRGANWTFDSALEEIDFNKYIIIADLVENEYSCPVCFKSLNNMETDNRRCSRCKSFITYFDESFQELIAYRNQRNLDTAELVQGYRHLKGLIRWSRYLPKVATLDDSIVDSLITIVEPKNPEDDVLPLG